jgi:hypothetical protein
VTDAKVIANWRVAVLAPWDDVVHRSVAVTVSSEQRRCVTVADA